MKHRQWRLSSSDGGMNRGLRLVVAALALLGARTAKANPDQSSSNDAIALVNWPDQHTEVFVQTLTGDMMHAFSQGNSDTWSSVDKLSSGARCGATSMVWTPSAAVKPYPQIFAPTAAGGTQTSWWMTPSSTWQPFQDFAGSGLSHLSTLIWPDNHVEVFALGLDHTIWHRFFLADVDNDQWTVWASLGGSNELVTGVSGLTWSNKIADIFAIDAFGSLFHNFSFSSTGWVGWSPIGSGIASRPAPVRWANGHLEVFARGTDGQLYHSYNKDQGNWPPLTVLSPGTILQGEPSAVMRPGGPEIFARDVNGKVVHMGWDGAAYTSFAPLLDQTVASDPFGWIRGDGSAEVFAIDPSGTLVRSREGAVDGGTSWSAWAAIGGIGLNPCVVAPPPPPQDAGVDAAGTGGTDPSSSSNSSSAGIGGHGGAGTGGHGDAGGAGNPASTGGCGCRTNATGDPSATWLAVAGLGLLALRRQRRR